jgi:hypothetical protein
MLAETFKDTAIETQLIKHHLLRRVCLGSEETGAGIVQCIKKPIASSGPVTKPRSEEDNTSTRLPCNDLFVIIVNQSLTTTANSRLGAMTGRGGQELSGPFVPVGAAAVLGIKLYKFIITIRLGGKPTDSW